MAEKTPAGRATELVTSARLKKTAPERIRVEFVIDDLISQLIKDLPSVAGCNGCSACSK
jgi:hypothetical protein